MYKLDLKNIFVPANALAWVMGVTIAPGQSVSVRCNNSVKYAPTPLYAQPEGHYADDTSPTHAFDPDNCIVYSGGTASTFPVSNTFPASLAMVAADASAGTPSIAGDLDGYRPMRDTTYTYEALAADLSLTGGELITLYFIFNDTLTGFANNSLSFLVTLTRYAQGASTVLLTPNIRMQFGPLSDAAVETPVDADTFPTTLQGFTPDEQFIAEAVQLDGSFGEDGQISQEEYGKWTAKLIPDFLEIGWWLSSAFCKPTFVLDGDGTKTWNGIVIPVGVSVYIWRPKRSRQNKNQAFCFDYGGEEVDDADNIILQCTRAEFDQFVLSTARKQNTGSISGQAGGFMRKPLDLDMGHTFVKQDAVWTIQVLGTPASGHTTVYNENGEHFQIQFDDTAGAATTAAEAMYGVGNIVIGKTSTTYTLTFGGDLAGENIPLPTIVDAYVGGSTPHTVFTEVTKGDRKQGPIHRWRTPEMSVWIGTNRAGLFHVDGDGLPDGVAMTDQFEFNMNFAGLRDIFFSENRAYASYKGSYEKGVTGGRTEALNVKAGMMDATMEFWRNWQSNTQRFIGFQVLSQDEIGSTGMNYEFRFSSKATVKNPKPFQDMNGISTMDCGMATANDRDYGGAAMEFVLITATQASGYWND